MMRLRSFCKSKIHRATVTGSDLDYIGSIAIDAALLELTDILENEKVCVWNTSNGARIETYAVPAEHGSGTVMVNGAAARLFERGDKIIVTAFTWTDEMITPRMILVDEANHFSGWLQGEPIPERL